MSYKGGHLNPAVSFAFLVQGKLSLLRFLVYTFAQNLGAFLGAVMVYLAYINELHEYSDGMQSFDTAGNNFHRLIAIY
jgi:glycerol uptake facilitator protein